MSINPTIPKRIAGRPVNKQKMKEQSRSTKFVIALPLVLIEPISCSEANSDHTHRGTHDRLDTLGLGSPHVCEHVYPGRLL